MNSTHPDKIENPQILITDDDPIIMEVLKERLSREYQIFCAENGSQAIEMAKLFCPDLILLDIVLPDLNGFEVCDMLKRCPKTKHIPIIFLTGNKTDSDHIAAGFRLGAVDYIKKPFKFDVLRARIHTHMELKKIRDELETRVQERTAELTEANKKMERTNIALQVLLEKREKDKDMLAENIISNVKTVIFPLLEKLRKSCLKFHQEICVNAIKSELNSITSQFSMRLSSKQFNLTPAEIQIASLIREGHKTKDIAALMNISEGTVIFHRNRIRKKLGLVNKKINLSIHLKSFEV